MAIAANKKLSKSSIGAPSQFKQSTRKGKKAWRKNVDIQEVEDGLDEMRAEERVTGSSLRSKPNEELFQVDVKGDNDVRRHTPKFDKTQLSYYKNLTHRSAIPAVFSRASAAPAKKYIRITQEEKKRLLRIAQRKRQGPLNSIEDTTKLGQGSALLEPSHAVKQSGTYDVWASQVQGDPHANVDEEKKEFLLPPVEKPSVKPPQVPSLREEISLPAVVPPHAGASYNPPATEYQELLRIAHEKAEKAEQVSERYARVKDEMEKARKAEWSGTKPGVPIGMIVDNLEKSEEEDNNQSTEELPLPKKPPTRKTKQQRKKAEKLRAEKRALAERKHQRRLLASLSTLKSTRKSVDKTLSSGERTRMQRRLILQEKLRRSGLAGQRLGKHIVPEAEPEVQLGDDLSESLRGLKVEGNLFRDRFLSLQHRALLEPRTRVLPKRHRATTKEVEKFAWKRFE
ncbi:hypothetical protein ACEPAG_1925 [Sanghuangporus baumii]